MYKKNWSTFVKRTTQLMVGNVTKWKKICTCTSWKALFSFCVLFFLYFILQTTYSWMISTRMESDYQLDEPVSFVQELFFSFFHTEQLDKNKKHFCPKSIKKNSNYFLSSWPELTCSSKSEGESSFCSKKYFPQKRFK